MVSKDKAVGHSAGLASVFILSTAATATRLIVDEVNPFDLALFRFAIPTVVFLLIVGVTRPQALRPESGQLWRLIASGLAFFAAFPILFNLALSMESASHAVILVSTIPLWSLSISAVTGGEYSRLWSKGAIVTALGIACVLIEGGREMWSADAMLMGCAFLAATNAQLTKTIAPKMGVVPLSAVTMFIGVCALLPLAMIYGNPSSLAEYSSFTLSTIIYLGVVPGCIGFYFRYLGISKLGPVHANWMPVFGVGFAILVLGERPSALTLLALGLAVAGSFLINRR